MANRKSIVDRKLSIKPGIQTELDKDFKPLAEFYVENENYLEKTTNIGEGYKIEGAYIKTKEMNENASYHLINIDLNFSSKINPEKKFGTSLDAEIRKADQNGVYDLTFFPVSRKYKSNGFGNRFLKEQYEMAFSILKDLEIIKSKLKN